MGYSNGANAATSLHAAPPRRCCPGRRSCAACCPRPPPRASTSPGVRVLVAAGRQDTRCSPAVARLLSALRAHGADVTEHWEPARHGLTQGDLEAVASWLGAA